MTSATPDVPAMRDDHGIPAAAWRRAFDAPSDLGHRAKLAIQHDGGALQGLPLGGFGTGGIGRDWRGTFRRWTVKPGALKHFVEPANGFAAFQQAEGAPAHAQVLQPREPGEPAPDGDVLGAWNWPTAPLEGHYAALFPKAWFAYPAAPGRPVEMVCEQFSPTLPDRYAETALPVGVFRWHLRNTADRPVRVGLMFSFTNLNGWFDEFGRGKPFRRNAGNINAALEVATAGGLAGAGAARGVIFDTARVGGAPDQNRGQWAIAAGASERIAVSRTVTFDALGDGAAVWDAFAATGAVPEDDTAWLGGFGFTDTQEHTLGGAVSATVTLAPGESLVVPMTLVWDLPVVQFGLGRRHWRRYTREIGRGGDNAGALVKLALDNADVWAAAIDAWHDNHAHTHGLAPWIDGMMFNQLYHLVDGYTAWTDGPVAPGDPAPAYFGVIECPDYPLYDTFDLWVYGSFALVAHWPDLERQVITAYAEQVLRDDPTRRRCTRTGQLFPIDEAGAVPHDLGGPEEDPGVLVNAYTYQNPIPWKDLPAMFVLTVARDVQVLDDPDLLRACWPAVLAAMTRLEAFDRDGDGLIENDGFPDQTIDNIPTRGASAYCCGLWLAGLGAAARLAEQVGEPDHAARWRGMFERGVRAYDEKLWCGTHYRWDTDSIYGEAVFIEQLFGPWYARRLGLADVVAPERMRRALATICRENLDAVAGGRLGAVNIAGFTQAIHADADAHGYARHQSDEVLIGLNCSLANQLTAAGMTDEAERVLAAIHRAVYEERGLWFRTPAAYDPEGTAFRAVMNMRSLVIWALVAPPAK